MSVGPLQSLVRAMNGTLFVTLVDGNGNIKYCTKSHNIVAQNILSYLASGIAGGEAPPTARYIYLWSMSGAPNVCAAMPYAFSGYGAMNASGFGGVGTAMLTGAINMGGAAANAVMSWVISGTFSFSGLAAGLSSIGGAVLAIGSAATVSNYAGSTGYSNCYNSWFAAATFTPIGIAAADKLSIVWAFCMCLSA